MKKVDARVRGPAELIRLITLRYTAGDVEAIIVYTCANCKVQACIEKDGGGKALPKNCPMNNEKYLKEIFQEYKKPEINKFYVATKSPGSRSGAAMFTPRLRRVIDVCKMLGYKKLGLAFCVGFDKEADLYSKILRQHGFEVVSVACCNGGFNVADHGVELPEGCDFDAACNPIGQARLLNEEKVDFNLVMGLCCGHDSLFLKHAEAMSTVIAVKDPATGHCPTKVLYLYDQYYERYFRPDPSEAE